MSNESLMVRIADIGADCGLVGMALDDLSTVFDQEEQYSRGFLLRAIKGELSMITERLNDLETDSKQYVKK
jgi:tRNA1(Val) A37 N6-methylase TrmN6